MVSVFDKWLALQTSDPNSICRYFAIGLGLTAFFPLQKDKDKFGNDVTFLARPLPVEYLIIDVSKTWLFIPHTFFLTHLLFIIQCTTFICYPPDVISSTDNYHVSKGSPVHLLLQTALPHWEPGYSGRNTSKSILDERSYTSVLNIPM